jgi:hypothetical protein
MATKKAVKKIGHLYIDLFDNNTADVKLDCVNGEMVDALATVFSDAKHPVTRIFVTALSLAVTELERKEKKAKKKAAPKKKAAVKKAAPKKK